MGVNAVSVNDIVRYFWKCFASTIKQCIVVDASITTFKKPCM